MLKIPTDNPMRAPLYFHLSRRESQIMDVLYRVGEASVSDVVTQIPDEPAYNTVRNTLTTLEKKGHVVHRQEGKRYLYSPSISLESVKRSAAGYMLQTFFGGSPSKAIVTLLGISGDRLTREGLDEVEELLARARGGKE